MNALVPILCLFLTFFCGMCFAEQALQGFYRGTAGRVVVNVCFDNQKSEYYAENSGKSIELMPMEGAPFMLMESVPYQIRFPEDFDAEWDNVWQMETHDGKLTGNRKLAKDNGAGVEPISLQKIAESCEPEYEQHRLSIPFKKDVKALINNVELQTLIHPVTGVQSVLVVSGIPADAAEKINKRFADFAQDFNQMWTVCSDWEGSITPRFISSLWMIFDTGTNGFCGGVHPNEDSTAISFFSQTGEPVDFESWIVLDYWNRGVHGKLKTELSKEVEDEGCIEKQEQLGWEYFQPWMGPDRFFFRLSETDRAYVYCEGDYGIPFDTMRQFIEQSHMSEFDQFVAVAKKFQQQP